MSEEKCDIVIITILDQELAALQKIFQFSEPEEQDGLIFRKCKFEENSRKFSIVCVQPYDYSNIPAAILATKAICKWDPRFVLVVGIAGGVSKNENLELGDVVIPKIVHYVEVEKIKDKQKLSRPYSIEPPAKEFKNSHQISREKNWADRITIEKPEGQDKPKVVFGEIISGEKLEADYTNESLQQRLQEYDKMIAVEMESGGVSKAVDENSDVHFNTKFFTVRGISDLCDLPDNQKYRDTWKKYAAEAAAAYAYELLYNLTVYQNQSLRFLDETPDYLLPVPEILFNITYSDDESEHDLTELSALLKNKKKVVLIGRAGIGKSNAANTIAREFLSDGVHPVIIDLKDWTPEMLAALQNTSDSKDKMNVLLRVSVGNINEKILSELGSDVVFIVDGLNEAHSKGTGNETVKEVISTVEEYVRNHANGALIMLTDRISRGLTGAYFKIELNNLSEGEVKRIIDANFGDAKFDSLSANAKDILKVPFFLNYALDVKNPDLISETKSLESFFTTLVGIDVDAMSKILFGYNKKNTSLLFDANDLEDKIGTEQYQKLLDSKSLIINRKGKAKFEHQLKHEYLISRYLATDESQWDVLSLDIATLGPNSIDSLFMTMEQLDEKEKCDKFILHVFNWNWRAAIRCIARLENREPKNYSDSTLVAVTALVAQKKFDHVHGTHREAIASSSGIKHETCQKISNAVTFDELLEIVNGFENEETWFTGWRDVFSWDSSKKLIDDDIMKINDDESIIGWTASNSLKRLVLDETSFGKLRAMYLSLLDDTHKHGTVRWRIVHTLGAFPSDENVDLLIKALESDPYNWTQFGAARSLMEMAAKTSDPQLRKRILEYFETNFGQMDDPSREEMGKTAMYFNAHGNWEAEVRPLLEKIGVNIDGELTKAEWGKIMNRFNEGLWKSR